MSILAKSLKAARRLRGVLPGVERGDTEITFALRAETIDVDFWTRVAQDFCVAHVMIDERANLFAAFRRIQRGRAALHRITDAVGFCAPTPMPERVQRQFFSRLGLGQQTLRHHRESAANTGESTRFGKAAQFNCAFPRAVDFKNGMRKLRFRNIRLISGVEE